MEIRTAVESRVRDHDETKREVLWEFPHERLDTYETTFSPDAFRASFEAELPVICWQHKHDEPLGRAVRAQALPHHNEVVGRFSDFGAVPLAHRAYTQIADGSLPGVSFGFERQAEEPHPDHRGATRITRARMQEVSPVTFPSIPGAKATGVRQEQHMEIQTILDLVDREIVEPHEARAMLADAGLDTRAYGFARDPAREGPSMGQGSVGAADVRPGMVVVSPDDSPRLVSAIAMPSPEVVMIHYEGEPTGVPYEPTTALGLVYPGAAARDQLPGPSGLAAGEAARFAAMQFPGDTGQRYDSQVPEYAVALDSALDEAERCYAAGDEERARALVGAAGKAADDLLTVMGIEDDDQRGLKNLGKKKAKPFGDEDDDDDEDEGRGDYPTDVRRTVSQKEREGMEPGDFAGKAKSFPINKPEDVKAAFASLGRAGADNYSTDQIKANIVRIAKRKGGAFAAALPDTAKREDARSEARARAMRTRIA
jgi:HK97 family phage prohead protease